MLPSNLIVTTSTRIHCLSRSIYLIPFYSYSSIACLYLVAFSFFNFRNFSSLLAFRNQSLSLSPRSRFIRLIIRELQHNAEFVRNHVRKLLFAKKGTNPLRVPSFHSRITSVLTLKLSTPHKTLDKRDGGRHGLERSLERLPIDPLWNSERQLQSPHNRTDRVRRRVRRGRRVGAPSSGEHTFAD